MNPQFLNAFVLNSRYQFYQYFLATFYCLHAQKYKTNLHYCFSPIRCISKWYSKEILEKPSKKHFLKLSFPWKFECLPQYLIQTILKIVDVDIMCKTVDIFLILGA